jgi:hypothetical protein
LTRPRAPGRDERPGVFFGKLECHAEAKPDRKIFTVRLLERRLELRVVYVYRPDLNAMLPRIAHQSMRRVKTRGLCVQYRCEKHVRMMAFHPA